MGGGGDPCWRSAPCPAPLRPPYLEDGVHDAAEGPISSVIRHAEDVQAPLVQIFQFLGDIEARGQEPTRPRSL